MVVAELRTSRGTTSGAFHRLERLYRRKLSTTAKIYESQTIYELLQTTVHPLSRGGKTSRIPKIHYHVNIASDCLSRNFTASHMHYASRTLIRDSSNGYMRCFFNIVYDSNMSKHSMSKQSSYASKADIFETQNISRY